VNFLRREPRKRSSSAKKTVGLARALSKLGYCSRSQAFELIRAGKVRLNGVHPRNPEIPVRMGVDRIEIEGAVVQAAEKIYLLMNKPGGLVTTADDEKGRETVYSLLPKNLAWIAPVGRLDRASEGLLLFTNDSAWAAKITDPESHLDKTYHVQIDRVADDDLIRQLESGVEVAGEERLRAKSARILRSGGKTCWLEIVLDEGKNRQIRRMFEASGVEVLRLVRVAIGSLRIGTLAKAAHRALTTAEKDALDLVLSASPKAQVKNKN
jgi:23S rRNA pseudouridine2605 synthase